MKEAMISPQETRHYQTGWDYSVTPPEPIYTDGYRVAQTVPLGQTFPMGEPVFWVECADEVEADTWFYVVPGGSIIPVPPIPFPDPEPQ